MVIQLPHRRAYELAARTLDDLGNRGAAEAYRRRADRLPAPAGARR